MIGKALITLLRRHGGGKLMLKCRQNLEMSKRRWRPSTVLVTEDGEGIVGFWNP